jgi:glycosyltransferase involved in cell wall biosynthesis
VSTRGRLCFYVPYLYPVAARSETELAGGIEVQHWALARALAAREFDVTVATCNYAQPRVVELDGVMLLSTYATDEGAPGIRFFYPRLWKSMRALLTARADVYIASGSSLHTGWAYDAARIQHAPFIFFAASDKDAFPELPSLTRRRERWWYLRALRGADARVAQTELQQRLLRENFGVDSRVIPNPAQLPPAPADAATNNVVLWLSTYKSVKRPEWFLELARRLPYVRFRMVGFPPSVATNRSWRDANDAARDLPNLEVHGFIEHARIGDFLQQAAIFVHTSPLEGFPNSLLEAWSYGVPTVSAVDPGGVVGTHKLGAVAQTVDDVVASVAALMESPDRRRTLGARARRYVEQHHGPDRTFEPVASLLDAVIQGKRHSTKR